MHRALTKYATYDLFHYLTTTYRVIDRLQKQFFVEKNFQSMVLQSILMNLLKLNEWNVRFKEWLT